MKSREHYSLAEKIKRTAKSTLARVYFATGYKKKIHLGNIIILMYHRVLEDYEIENTFLQPGMYVTRKTFETHLSFLNEHYRVISLKDLINHFETGKLDAHQQYCIITFDDGWIDNYKNAYPLLKKYKTPATIFLVTSFIRSNGDFWVRRFEKLIYCIYRRKSRVERSDLELMVKNAGLRGLETDELYSLLSGEQPVERVEVILDEHIERLKEHKEPKILELLSGLEEVVGYEGSENGEFLGWEEIREMSENKISFGSHGSTHRILTRCSSDQLEQEVEGSHEILSRRGINYVPVFSYPNGDFNEEVIGHVRRAGYKAAVSTLYGINRVDRTNPFNLKRVAVHEDIASDYDMFAFHLSGIVNYISPTKRKILF